MYFNIIAFIISIFLMLVYYFYLSWQTRHTSNLSVHDLNARVREQWVSMIMNKANTEILAIQTLRNSVMAASFMATTVLLLIIGALNLSDKIGQWSLHWHPLILADSVSGELWQLKLVLLLLDFSIAFYCFSMAIRFFNHVGYMINLPADASIDGDLYKQTCTYLNKAGSYYKYGMRSFFFSWPIMLWFFGPHFLVLATCSLIAGLAMFDKVPR